jgi:lipoprotein Spr
MEAAHRPLHPVVGAGAAFSTSIRDTVADEPSNARIRRIPPPVNAERLHPRMFRAGEGYPPPRDQVDPVGDLRLAHGAMQHRADAVGGLGSLAPGHRGAEPGVRVGERPAGPVAAGDLSPAAVFTRQANAELTTLTKKNANVEMNETTSTAGKKSRESSAKALVKKYAALMKVESSTLDNIAMLHFIDEWYGVPYKYAGRDKKGIDCSGFTCTLFNDVYKQDASGTSASLYAQCKKIKRSELQEGDLVFFKINRGRISHVGVFVANDYFVHASTKAGVVLSSLDEPYYKKYYAGAGRLKD